MIKAKLKKTSYLILVRVLWNLLNTYTQATHTCTFWYSNLDFDNLFMHNLTTKKAALQKQKSL